LRKLAFLLYLLSMATLTSTGIAKGCSAAISRVLYQRQRLVLTRHGRPVAALVPLEDLDKLALAERSEAFPWRPELRPARPDVTRSTAGAARSNSADTAPAGETE
jgi:antitoxin (DNA-binding transcriptional repressor) of toxin-antitoxin stability system